MAASDTRIPDYGRCALPLPSLAGSSVDSPGTPSAGLSAVPAAGSPAAAPWLLRDEPVSAASGARFAFCSRLGGSSAPPYDSLNVSTSTGDDPAAVARNRRIILDALGVGGREADLVTCNQVHGDDVVVLRDPAAESAYDGSAYDESAYDESAYDESAYDESAYDESAYDESGVGGGGSGSLVFTSVADAQSAASVGADAVVCLAGGVPVMLAFADCVPVILVAGTGAFAVVHSGWRGTLAGISGKALSILARESGCPPAECNAYIGPHIGPCCYEVSGELLGRFTETWGPACDAGSEAPHLALAAAVRESLLRAGADGTRIAESGICTACHTDMWYSHRAEMGRTGRHAAAAVLA